MLEEVVRQLSQDVSLAEKAASSSKTQADVGMALKAPPATEREVKALHARVSCFQVISIDGPADTLRSVAA